MFTPQFNPNLNKLHVFCSQRNTLHAQRNGESSSTLSERKSLRNLLELKFEIE